MNCSKCQTEYEGKQYYCKLCLAAYNKTYRETHPEYRRKYYQNNKGSEKVSHKKWLKENPSYMSEYMAEYNKKNKPRRASAKRKRSKEDPAFRLRNYISKTVYLMIKSQGENKRGKSILSNLNYSLSELKLHVESLFEHWMTWDNQGIYDPFIWDDNNSSTWRWQLDHIIPQSDLPYENMACENFQKCWALSNLRPLSAKQNYTDGIYRVRHKNNLYDCI